MACEIAGGPSGVLQQQPGRVPSFPAAWRWSVTRCKRFPIGPPFAALARWPSPSWVLRNPGPRGGLTRREVFGWCAEVSFARWPWEGVLSPTVSMFRSFHYDPLKRAVMFSAGGTPYPAGTQTPQSPMRSASSRSSKICRVVPQSGWPILGEEPDQRRICPPPPPPLGRTDPSLGGGGVSQKGNFLLRAKAFLPRCPNSPTRGSVLSKGKKWSRLDDQNDFCAHFLH